MSESAAINLSALEPLFAPWDEPTRHRVRGEKPGDPSRIIDGRRPSPIPIVRDLRWAIREWRESFYAGASDTSRHLLNHWFNRSHRGISEQDEEFEFHYYFCQREAIETLIYLKEVRNIERLSQLIAEFGGPSKEIQALGITEEEDLWSRYAFKVATGAGKTKIMSLAIVWSYFHSLRESDSPMARHFVLIAPNLTVYERLREDFGDDRIFDKDPLIPAEWRGDWNMSTVLQDQSGGAVTGGAIYLTNIHRLFDPEKRKKSRETQYYDFVGPSVSKANALDTAAALRDRITAHPTVMVLNDEAHHVWDPDSAWNEAIDYLHNTILSRGGRGLTAQLDFSATPKDNKGQRFKHIICDTPLGEAVDGGIVKTPIIGKASQPLAEQPGDNAAYVYDRHLRLGYERWKVTNAEWEKSGKKTLMFVMCEDTDSADQIARRLNSDETFKELNGKTINLHTNLKGKVKKIGRGEHAQLVFVETEKEITDNDLEDLRKLSRELDKNSSPYRCIVSVLMLREGWDVRNVTTIVPLRPLSAKAEILPEQTLGRGLRKMTPPGQANEIVVVVDHPAFANLYQQQLAQEGLPIEIVDVDQVPPTTVTIFPDENRKDIRALEILVPRLSPGHRIVPKLDSITLDEVKERFKPFTPLPLASKISTEIEYEGRQLFTGEVVERMKFHIPLLESGVGAVSYFVQEWETACKVRGIHRVIAPLLTAFLEEILFDRKTSLFDPALVARLGDSDVAEHLRAVFVPLIRKHTTTTEERLPDPEPVALSCWKPFQVTHSERKPVVEAKKTLFNLVPCNRGLEVAMTEFLDNKAADIVAFAKNAGPQSLRIDYIGTGGRLGFYTPDFFVRAQSGKYYLVETKGREDLDVPRKARAAIEWCKCASTRQCPWEFVYVTQGVFEALHDDSIEALTRTCAPALQALLSEEQDKLRMPLFASVMEQEGKETAPLSEGIVDKVILEALPERYRKGSEEAIALFRYMENKQGMNLAPMFQPLLGCIDEASRALLSKRLSPTMPAQGQQQIAWFSPYMDDMLGRAEYYKKIATNLRRTLIFQNGISPLGLLRTCLDYAINDNTQIKGVFESVRAAFKIKEARNLLTIVTEINDFRNTFVAHQEKRLTDIAKARTTLSRWIAAMYYIHRF